MKAAVALLVFLYHQASCYNYTTKYLDVPVDHFSFTNNATFKLKYLINDSFWEGNGPIFFYTGNEGTIENFAENTGFMYEIAPQFNALLVFAEHRFYGTSLPFGNESFTSLNHLGYLTSSQALADFVFVIDYLQTNRRKEAYEVKIPVVAFGGSYGGMLAAWLRMKYPAAVVGAIASSAPIWQFNGLTPCENFYRIVTQVYRYAIEEDCSAPIQSSWKLIRNLTATDAGKAQLTKDLKLCTPLKTEADINNLIDWLNNVYVNMAMVNYPYATSFLVPLPAYPVTEFCKKLMADIEDSTILKNLAAALEIYTNYTGDASCVNINSTSPALGENAWDFQACTEIIMPICSTETDMFENSPWNFTTFADTCFKTWGVNQRREDFPVLEYGGKDIRSASNIVFSNGLHDPWSTGGVLTNISSSVNAVLIPEGAHHLDLRADNPEDPVSVRAARQFHVDSIQNWINEFQAERNINYFHWHRNDVKVVNNYINNRL